MTWSNIIPKVLITNDDGPPGPESPFIEGLVSALQSKLGWDVSVCIPASQRSWVGKAFLVNEKVHLCRYTPQNLGADENNKEWYLAEGGTPASCANIALNHLFSNIDIVISGPNLGCNVSSSATLTSGTLGAALEAALLGYRSIALSYVFYSLDYSSESVSNACDMACNVLEKLWRSNMWERIGAEVFNVNVPLVEHTECPVFITTLGHSSLGSLYKEHDDNDNDQIINPITSLAKAPDNKIDNNKGIINKESSNIYIFSSSNLYDPVPKVGTDSWAIRNNSISVTPIKAELRTVESHKRQVSEWAELGFKCIDS